MSKKDEWGNIELPGISDNELLSKNWNYVAANREKAQDSKFKEKLSKSITQSYKDNPDLAQEKGLKLKECNKVLFQDPEYYAIHANRNKAQVSDPLYMEALQKGIAKREANSEYVTKRKENAKKRSKDPEYLKFMEETHGCKVSTPQGEFNSWKAAEIGTGLSKHVIKQYILKGYKGYSVQETKRKTKVTGKPVVTEFGIFRSISQATTKAIELHLKNPNKIVKILMIKNPKQNYYISIEEYIMLTGKEL